ncbi:MAG: fatty acid desaturase [Aphanocapsa sp. GSE-SYN-MK-11-07L]|jgi:fatty acid desaturase|nr:fatty acid desaturase [Aphanocapsa sp. GSE-SYN-MK-11-07L]
MLSTPLAQPNLKLYLQNRKPVWNAIALLYTLTGYSGGIALLLINNGWLNAIGVVLLCHSLMYAGYLSHEFLHGTVFQSARLNQLGGNLMIGLTGNCYRPFSDMVKLHMAHHAGKVSPVQLGDYVRSLPAWLQWTVLGLEWSYFPAMHFVLKGRLLTAPFRQPGNWGLRSRTLALLLLRGVGFTLLGYLSGRALLLYFLAYLLAVTLLRIEETFQHAVVRTAAGGYEETFSPLLSERYGWLSLLFLNFSYHNAHHVLPRCPWYNLPVLDQALAADRPMHHLSLIQLLANYHRFRLTRILEGTGQPVDQQGKFNLDRFYGRMAPLPL